MFKIEKNVPLSKVRGIGGRSKYPFAAMAQGDSFLVPGNARVESLRVTANFWGRKLGVKFVTRTIKGEGIRVWHTGPRKTALRIAAE